jgi:hypothetical protein
MLKLKRFDSVAQALQQPDVHLRHRYIGAMYDREGVLRLQFTKLLNYFLADLEEEWGGHFAVPEPESLTLERAQQAWATFIASAPAEGKWMHKRMPTLPWGPDNYVLRDEYDVALGMPYEHYIAAGAGILTLNVAQQFLCVRAHQLAAMKQRLLLDTLVIEECVRRQCRPKPTWPRVKATRGLRGNNDRTGGEAPIDSE